MKMNKLLLSISLLASLLAGCGSDAVSDVKENQPTIKTENKISPDGVSNNTNVTPDKTEIDKTVSPDNNQVIDKNLSPDLEADKTVSPDK